MVIDSQGEKLTPQLARIFWARIQLGLGLSETYRIRSVHMSNEILTEWENTGLVVQYVDIEYRPVRPVVSRTFMGHPLVIDSSLPSNEIQFRDVYSNLMVSIINIGSDTTIRPYRRIKS